MKTNRWVSLSIYTAVALGGVLPLTFAQDAFVTGNTTPNVYQRADAQAIQKFLHTQGLKDPINFAATVERADQVTLQNKPVSATPIPAAPVFSPTIATTVSANAAASCSSWPCPCGFTIQKALNNGGATCYQSSDMDAKKFPGMSMQTTLSVFSNGSGMLNNGAFGDAPLVYGLTTQRIVDSNPAHYQYAAEYQNFYVSDSASANFITQFECNAGYVVTFNDKNSDGNYQVQIETMNNYPGSSFDVSATHNVCPPPASN